MAALGISQAVRQRTLNPPSGVRIPHPQPSDIFHINIMKHLSKKYVLKDKHVIVAGFLYGLLSLLIFLVFKLQVTGGIPLFLSLFSFMDVVPRDVAIYFFAIVAPTLFSAFTCLFRYRVVTVLFLILYVVIDVLLLWYVALMFSF